MPHFFYLAVQVLSLDSTSFITILNNDINKKLSHLFQSHLQIGEHNASSVDLKIRPLLNPFGSVLFFLRLYNSRRIFTRHNCDNCGGQIRSLSGVKSTLD